MPECLEPLVPSIFVAGAHRRQSANAATKDPQHKIASPSKFLSWDMPLFLVDETYSRNDGPVRVHLHSAILRSRAGAVRHASWTAVRLAPIVHDVDCWARGAF